jgi:hypothetical protein
MNSKFGRLAAAAIGLAVFIEFVPPSVQGAPPGVLPGTAWLEAREGYPALIVSQWDAFLLGEIEKARAGRDVQWKRDYASPAAYPASLAPKRERFRRIVGAVDEGLPATDIELTATLNRPAVRAETDLYSVLSVRWPVMRGVHGEGLLLKPKTELRACVVAVPDADQTPEMLAGLNPGIAPESQFARRLAEQGVLVVIPTLIDRRSRWSRDERTGFQTDQTHREWIYRQAAVLGRHIIGYEVQKAFGSNKALRTFSGWLFPTVEKRRCGFRRCWRDIVFRSARVTGTITFPS